MLEMLKMAVWIPVALVICLIDPILEPFGKSIYFH